MKRSIITLFAALGFVILASSQVLSYRQLPEFQLSQVFNVDIRQGGNPFQRIYTYGIPNIVTGMVTKVEHIAMFAFEPSSGPVDIKITSATGAVFDASVIELVNKMYEGVTTSFSGNAMILTVNVPKKQLFVRLKSNYGNPLMIFADPVKESDIPASANVVRFTASSTPYIQTAQYDRYTVPNNVDIVYIEDGAMIKGTIHTDAGRSKPLKLMGRGVIIGNGEVLHGSTYIPYNAVVLTDGSGNTIEGITVMNSRHFSVDVGDYGHIDNVKMFGYDSNNDGIVTGINSLVEYCFLKVNDDHIKLYKDNLTVRNCVFYVQTNGALFQFSWNQVNPGDNCLVENCEVVAVEYTGCGDPVSGTGGIAHCMISLREEEADGKALINGTIRNIIVQGQLLRFIGINGYEFKGIDISGLVIENINVLNAPGNYSWVYTKDAYSINMRFNNVVFGNRAIALSDFHTLGNVTLTFDNLINPFNGKIPEYQYTTGLKDIKMPTVLRPDIHYYKSAGQIMIGLPPDHSYEVCSLYSLSGILLKKQNVPKGDGNITFNVNNLNHGLYLLMVDRFSFRFVK